MSSNIFTTDWIIDKFNYYYAKYEDFILKEEQNEDLKILKKILVYYIPFLMGYFILLPLFNPYISFTRGFVSLTGIIIYYFMLRVKNFTIAVVYILGHAVFTLYMCSKNPHELLRSIGMILVQHNQAMVINQHRKLGFVFIITSMVLVYRSQDMLNQFIDENDFERVKDAVRGLQYTWPLLYIMNTSFIINVTKRYCKAIHENREAQTELKAKNQELFGLNEKLKRTLSLLEQANKELKDAVNARELFIASVSHELRNPLNSMLGNIELLGLEVKDSRWIKMLDACKICGEVLLGLINNVLDVAKINAERLELNIQPGNLHRLIENVWVVSTVKMRQKGIKGHLLIGSNVPKYIQMDTNRVNQILLNLIGNATKFTKEGFVKVMISWQIDGDMEDLQGSSSEFMELARLKTGGLHDSESNFRNNASLQLDYPNEDNGDWIDNSTLEDLNSCSFSSGHNHKVLLRSFRIKSLSQVRHAHMHSFDECDMKIQDKLASRTVHAAEEKGILKIEIIDSGCGISKAALHKLFQPFSQADPSVTRCFGGTGLGLYITKQLVNKMNGQIGVESQKHIGSSFWMILPSRNAEKPETEEDDSSEACVSKSKNLTALVVDDDPLNQIIMTSYLKKLNIKADVASNGYEALQKFKEKEPNYYCLITMDIQMPIMDGLSACKAIRRYEAQIHAKKNIPIIMVTANCIDINKHQYLDPNGEIKASYFFRKPFKFEECQSSINTLLHKAENGVNTMKCRVLIVDDDMFNRDILRDFLEKYRFECEVCVNGREAVSKVNQHKYDVVLMDCEMPEMNGYTAAKLIREKYPRLPIIGVTGNLREDCLKKARASGMNDVESKPVNFQNLIRHIKKVI